MATQYLGTTTITPVWCQSDAEVPHAEQARRLSVFRVKVLQEIDQDCTQVVEFCETWRQQGLYSAFAPTWDAFCTDVLRVEPGWVDHICQAVHQLRAEGYVGAVPVSMAERVGAVAALRDTPGAPAGNQNAVKNNGSHDYHCSEESKRQERGSRYRIARLKRDHPAIAEALAQGAYPSVNAAWKAAGLLREPSPLTTLHKVWRHVSPEDRLRFLIEMLTPNERRALQFGYEEEA